MELNGNEASTMRRANAPIFKKYGLTKSEIVSAIVTLAILVLLVLEIFIMVTCEGTYVIDRSMYPTLNGAPAEKIKGGDYIIINKYDKPDYGDIVVVYNERERKNIIKRAVAFGGDTVEMREGVLYLNGQRQEESYLDRNNITPTAEVNNFPPYEVEAGCIFLLGDNRDESVDSRARMAKNSEGFKLSDVKGVVTTWSMAIKPVLTGIYTLFNF